MLKPSSSTSSVSSESAVELLTPSRLLESSDTHLTWRLVGLKVAAFIACFVSVIPFITPAMEVSSDYVLKHVFACGEMISWGTLYTWCAFSIIDRVVTSHTRISRSKKYWISLIAFGLITQIPAAYVTYYYNRNLFWTVFSPAIYSVFSINSLDCLNYKVVREDNFITRTYSMLTNQENHYLKLRHRLAHIIDNCAVTVFDAHNQNLILEVMDRTDGQINRFTLEDIDILHNCSQVLIKRRAYYFRLLETIFMYLGAGLSLSKSILEFRLNKDGFRLLKCSQTLAKTLAFFTILPNIYLGWDVSKSTYQKIFQLITKNCSYQIRANPIAVHYPKVTTLTRLVCTLIGAFGTGSLITTLKDNFGFHKLGDAIFGIVVISTVAILTLNSMYRFTDRLLEWMLKETLPERDKQLLKMRDQLRSISANLHMFNNVQIKALLTQLDVSSVDALQRWEGIGLLCRRKDD